MTAFAERGAGSFEVVGVYKQIIGVVSGNCEYRDLRPRQRSREIGEDSGEFERQRAQNLETAPTRLTRNIVRCSLGGAYDRQLFVRAGHGKETGSIDLGQARVWRQPPYRESPRHLPELQ